MLVKNRSLLSGLFISAMILAILAGPALLPARAANKPFMVEARTTTFGGSSYILGFGICDLLNKYSSSLRGAVLESSGSAENIRLVAASPAKSRRTFFTCSVDMFDLAKQGKPPFAKNSAKIKQLMVLSFQQALAGVIITLDPNLKTLADLKNKRVSTWPRGTTKFDLTHSLIAGAGKDVVDSVKWQYTGYAGYGDMILGKTDAAFAFIPERGPGIYTTVPKLKELMAKRRVYFVSATPEMRQRTMRQYGRGHGATATLPKDALGPGVPRYKVMGINIVLGWCVYPDMPKKVAYGILKTMYEHRAQLKGYHSAGKNITRSRLGAYPAAEADWHPGAVEFFNKEGIPFGEKYFFSVYPLK